VKTSGSPSSQSTHMIVIARQFLFEFFFIMKLLSLRHESLLLLLFCELWLFKFVAITSILVRLACFIFHGIISSLFLQTKIFERLVIFASIVIATNSK